VNLGFLHVSFSIAWESKWMKWMAAISIKDVAKAADISYSTVSRALNDSPRVKPETKERIQRIAREMGYLPSGVARSLVTRRTHTVGVVVSTITDLFFAEVIYAIEEIALSHKYSVILANSGGEPARELAAIRALLERRVDGIIVVAGCSEKDDMSPERGIEVPLVIINNVHQEHPGYSVEVDNIGGGRLAIQHLAELGHRRIAHIAGPITEWDGVERLRGYEQGLQTHQLPLDPHLIARGSSRPEGGMTAMHQLLALQPRPTAVFCYNDVTALGAMRTAHAAGLRIPHDLSVVGFDDIDLSPFFEPPLTTIAQPKRKMGEKAMQMILDLLAGETIQDCVLPSELVVRGSTMPLAG
jgi:LacI family repressor for deo operon, udp, cdd, tsx, nupC, and nupG